MEVKWCVQGSWLSFVILSMLKRWTRAMPALPTSTWSWILWAEGLDVSWRGLGSSLRLDPFLFLMLFHKSYFALLQIYLFHMSFRFTNYLSCFCKLTLLSCKLSSCKLYPYAVSCKLSWWKLYLFLFFQTIILQIVSILVLPNYYLTNYICSCSCKWSSCSILVLANYICSCSFLVAMSLDL